MSDIQVRPDGDAAAEVCHQVEVELTDDLYIRCSRFAVADSVRRSRLLLIAVFAVLGLMFVADAPDAAGRLSGVARALGLLAIALAVQYLLVWRTIRKAARALGEFPSRRWTYRFTREGVEVHEPVSSSVLDWAAFREVRRSPDVWLLRLAGQAQYWIFPVHSVTPEAREFIEKQVLAHGGKVR